MFSVLSRSVLPVLRSFPSTLSFASKPSFNFGFGGLLGRGLLLSRVQPPLVLLGERGKCCLKTNKSAAKRFRVRGNGRLRRNKAGRSHNTGHKGRKRVNNLAATAPVKELGIENRMRRLIRA
eukprot:g4131.t1 g4131   contig15:409984-410503(-)